MSDCTKFRTFNLSSSQFDNLNRELKRIFRVASHTAYSPTSPVLDMDYRSVKPGEPIKGIMRFTKMNGVVPRFYLVGELLTIGISNAISTEYNGSGSSGSAQEFSFWCDIEQAVRNVGGRSAGFDKPPNLPPDAMDKSGWR